MRRLISEFNAVAVTQPVGQQHTCTAHHAVTKFLYGADDAGRVHYVGVTIRLIVLRFLLISLSNRGAHLIVSVYLI